MSAQRHRIRRQVLEIILRDQGAAWQLSSEISRIQRESLETIIDQCCAAAGDPDRLHRIDSLEVDLGRIHPDHLEHDLVERLGPRLRAALVARVGAEDQATSLAGADPETISRLELVAFFARTGSLPWWADASRPRLLDETVGFLLQRAARPLVALVRALARSQDELRRLVLHCEDERLSALFAAVVTSTRGLAQRPAELRGLLTAHRAIAGVLPSSFRTAVWVAALRTVSIEEKAGADAVELWREALAHAALELGVTYTFLVTSLHENRESSRDAPAAAAAAIVQRLYREARGETIADSALRGSLGDVAAMVDRLEQLGIEPRALLSELLRVLEELEASAPAEAFRAAHSLLRRVIEKPGGDASADSDARADRDARAADSDAPAAPGDAPGDAGAADVETLLDRLEGVGILPSALATELRARARRLPVRSRIRLLRTATTAEHTAATAEEAARIAEEMKRLLDRLEAWEDLGQVLAARRLPARALERALEELERSAAVRPPSPALGEASRLPATMPVEAAEGIADSPALDLAYGDSEDAYVENAGLVVLWPFLGHLFERLELMADKQFKDLAAQHRAVGLLQYLATEDPWPQEYQLLLAKVLCGMNVHEVFDFGPPVTEAEAEETAGMLTAAIASAPILRDMSIDGFRSSFLLRKGVIGARDGAWLLRVERATHDVVLDRFPWAVSWVKLPWMEAPLSVEW